MILFIWNVQNSESIETEGTLVVSWVRGGDGGMGECGNVC